ALHQRARVQTEALLSRHEGVAVVRIFHVPRVGIFRNSNLVMWAEDQTRSLTREKPTQRLDLILCCFLSRDVMIQSEDKQRVRVIEHAFVERKLEAGLIDALEDGDRVSGDFADVLLERREGPEKKLERAGNSLLELKRIGPLRRFIRGPRNASHFGHRRESVIELGRISSRLG